VATKLTRDLSRQSTGLGVNRRRFVITLAPGDVIGFRDLRSRKTYWTSLALCYAMAVRQTVAKERADARRAKQSAR
jgi:hypothetical protein